ncbi:MAG: hypothetical protein RLY17_77 [Pseudomonadota bacterium]|jgi:type VI secretion system protein ImpL
MKRFFLWFLKPWLLSLLGVIFFSLVLWFEGPLLSFNGQVPLGATSTRWKVIGVLFLLWALWLLWKYCAIHWATRKLAQAMVGDEAPGAREAEQELAALRQRMRDALAVLRKTGKGRRGNYLYQLPWYLFIGAPGSGKTTALVHSGLKFSLADEQGPAAVGGVGGTRRCDWWFSDEAVLLDTSGRYTTLDSYAQVDQSGWNVFLQLLKKYRRRRPINGAIVVLSVADLLQLGAAGRTLQAQAIRARVKALHEQLGIRFPIYVVVTKCDLLAGFVEFFEPLGREERDQVWGMTFPSTKEDSLAQALAAFPEEFSALERQLQVRMLPRMQQERDLQRRALLYCFPQQFAGIGPVLGDFLNEVFAPTRYEKAALLRGVYFTSGTQEGSPIDRVSLASAFGLGRKILPNNVALGKRYFLTNLLRDVVFKEAALVESNPHVERRWKRLQWLGYAAIGLVLVLSIAGMTTSYWRNQQYIDRVKQQAAEVDKLASALPANASLTALLPILDAARSLTGRYDGQADKIPWLNRFGLSQNDKLGSGSRGLYKRLLRETLMPRILGRLEEVLKEGEANNQEYLYATLRVYLMLGDHRYLDPESVLAWLSIDWPRSQAPATPEQIQKLLLHAGAFLRHGDQSVMPPVLDPTLIAQTRLTLAIMPVPLRIYNRLKRELEAVNLPEFSVNHAVGHDVSQLFTRLSGAPLSRGVEGVYSPAGYSKLQQLIGPAINDSSKDNWVLDRRELEVDSTEGSMQKRVLELYYLDYIQQWDTFLADVRIVPFSSLDQAARVTNALSASDSPMVSFLQGAARETTLANIQPPKNSKKALDDVVQTKLAEAKKKLEAAIGNDADATTANTVATTPVDQHFDGLHKLVGAPVSPLLATFKDAAQYFEAADNAWRNGLPPPSDEVLTRIKSDAQDKPAPLNAIMQNIDNGGGALAIGKERERLNSLWSSSAAFCQQAISGRYPLVRSANKEVTLDDFGKFFGPGGLMDDFFTKNLKPYVDMSDKTWRWRTESRTHLGISAQVLTQFQRAAQLRDMFFASGKAQPSLSFSLTPLDADSALHEVRLSIDGQPVNYVATQPPQTVAIVVPHGKNASQVQFVAKPALLTKYSSEGPWAWFRMMDRGVLQPTTQGERYRLTFNLDGHYVIYQLDASSVINPFRRTKLQQFRCPVAL